MICVTHVYVLLALHLYRLRYSIHKNKMTQKVAYEIVTPDITRSENQGML